MSSPPPHSDQSPLPPDLPQQSSSSSTSSSLPSTLTQTPLPLPIVSAPNLTFLREHYTKKGYTVHSGLQYGTHLVLYSDSVNRVHSDFAVLLLNEEGSPSQPQDGEEAFDFRTIQTLTRQMPAIHKKLIVCRVHTNIETKERTVQSLLFANLHKPFKVVKTKKVRGRDKGGNNGNNGKSNRGGEGEVKGKAMKRGEFKANDIVLGVDMDKGGKKRMRGRFEDPDDV